MWSRARTEFAAARSSAAAILALLLSSGCFHYVPTSPQTIAPEEEVRVRFTDDAAIRLARQFGRIMPQLEGRLEERSPDTLQVSVLIGQAYPGTAFENVRQTVAFSRQDLMDVRRRKLDVTRTALAGVGVVVAFGYLVSKVFQQEDPNVIPPTDVPPPPPDGSLFLLRIPLRFGGSR